MKKYATFLLVSISLIGFSGCEKPESDSASQPSQSNAAKLIENSQDVPVDAVFYNGCCNEDVYVTGNAHIVVNNNVIHIVVTDIAGTGLTTGYAYTNVGASVFNNVNYSSTFEGSLVTSIKMKNNNGCSFKLKTHFHINVNANGEITSEFQNMSSECN